MFNVLHGHEVVLLVCEEQVDGGLLGVYKWHVVNRFAHKDRAHVDSSTAWINQKAERDSCEQGVEFPHHHHTFPTMLDALGAQ